MQNNRVPIRFWSGSDSLAAFEVIIRFLQHRNASIDRVDPVAPVELDFQMADSALFRIRDPVNEHKPQPVHSNTPDRGLPDRESGHSAADLADALQRSLKATANQHGDVSESQHSQGLLQVVRRHKGQPLSLEPVLTDLVAAANCGLLSNHIELRNKMNSAVAETIFGDAAARQRVEQLWHELQLQELS